MNTSLKSYYTAAIPVVSVECDEPKKKIVRNIYPLLLTPNNLEKLYELSSRHRTLMGNEIEGNFHRFCELFIGQHSNGEIYAKGLFWVVDDFIGMFSLINIDEYDAVVHMSMFDGRFKGRGELVKKMIQMVFDVYHFQRLSVEIGAYAGSSVFNFVESVGFRREGKKRSAVKYKNKLFDLYIYGILKEETI